VLEIRKSLFLSSKLLSFLFKIIIDETMSWKGWINVLLFVLLIGVGVWLFSIYNNGSGINTSKPFRNKLRIECIRLISLFSGITPGSDPSSFSRLMFDTFLPMHHADSVHSYKVQMKSLSDNEISLHLFLPETFEPKRRFFIISLKISQEWKN
jgi:hypothetical protein